MLPQSAFPTLLKIILRAMLILLAQAVPIPNPFIIVFSYVDDSAGACLVYLHDVLHLGMEADVGSHGGAP